jgi:hypothetical protein
MIQIHYATRYILPGMLLVLSSAIILFGSIPPAQAAREAREPQREFREGRDNRREFRDSRYHHDRFYPTRGQVVRSLPNDHRVVVHGGARFYFSGGVWYRPQGPRFAIVAPPIGLFIPFLPPFYSTVWVGGRPYYYANESYYVSHGSGYTIVEPPKGEIRDTPPQDAAVAPIIDQLYVYPRQNQSPDQQAADRYECHRWAASQTAFDPTQLAGGVPEDQKSQKRSDYQRAMSACLEGRGYTVR